MGGLVRLRIVNGADGWVRDADRRDKRCKVKSLLVAVVHTHFLHRDEAKIVWVHYRFLLLVLLSTVPASL